MNPVLEVIKYSFDHLGEKYQQVLRRLYVFGNSFFETDEAIFMTQQKKDDVIMSLFYLTYKNLIELKRLTLNHDGKEHNQFIYYLHPLVLLFLNRRREQFPHEDYINAGRKFIELMIKRLNVLRKRIMNVLLKHFQYSETEPQA